MTLGGGEFEPDEGGGLGTVTTVGGGFSTGAGGPGGTGGVPGVLPGKVVVLGGGSSCINAARMAQGLGNV